MTKNLSSDLKLIFKKSKKYYQKRILEEYPDTSPILKKHEPVLIFGAGNMGKLFAKNLKKKGVSVLNFIDNNPSLQKTKIKGIEVISLQEAKQKYLTHPILIASLLYETEIYNLLLKSRFEKIYPLIYLNFINPDIFVSPEYHNTFNFLFVKKNQKNILKLLDLIKDKQSKEVFENLIKFRLTMSKIYLKKAMSKKQLFFEKNIMPLSKNEILADCGAFDGDSIENFIKATSSKYSSIYSFEPDPNNFKNLKIKIAENKWENITPIKKGVFNKTGKVKFTGNFLDARIATKESVTKNLSSISVVKIDDYFKNKKPPTLIKMDIEGAETEALMGGKNIIKKYKPKLAISVYHLSTDPWSIPLLILKLNKNYKLYFRHYSNELPDTICYAI